MALARHAKEKPLIDPGYLSDEADVDVLMAGVRQVREIMAQEPLARLAKGEDVPGEQVTNDEQLRAWIRGNVHSMFHPTSTCAMGGAETAVCDPWLRVRGVVGLRVVDASVMPTIPHGPPIAAIIAIAERASDIIKGHDTAQANRRFAEPRLDQERTRSCVSSSPIP